MTRASTILFWFSLALIVSLGLYHTSYRVEALSNGLKELNTKIASEQRTLHILKAEWVFLSNPTRLEAAAKKHLADLHPTAPAQVTKSASLIAIAPTRAEAMGTTTVAAAPVANLDLRAAAHSPKSSGEEKNHINNRMVIGKTASAEGYSAEDRLNLQKTAYTLATSGDAP